MEGGDTHLTLRYILLTLLFGVSSLPAQTFRLSRPVPDNIQTNGSYLYGEPRLSNPSLAHTGIDISIQYDTVRAATDGVVSFVGYNPGDPTGGYEPGGGGNYVFVQTPWGGGYLFHIYMHLTRPLVNAGDNVTRAMPIAISGNTGNTTGPHLHFELRLGSSSSGASRNRRNPELWAAITGMGAIYGRVPGAGNSTRVDISPYPKPKPPYTTFGWALTYNFNDPGIGSDDLYNENFAIGDVVPGTYTITALSGTYRRVVTVGPGQVVNAEASSSVVADPPPLPAIAELAQNYPNPFNPATTVQVNLAGPHRLSVRVYDLLGREVALIAEGEYDAGRHSFSFDASGSPSGVYFCRMSAVRLSDGSTVSAVRRMVLQR